jgi:hypothetical protein
MLPHFILDGDGAIVGHPVDLGFISHILAVSSWGYSSIVSWPTVRTVCRGTNTVLYLPWRFARHEPRDGLCPRNDRCALCGWLTGNLGIDDVLCDSCGAQDICADCSHSINGRRLCVACAEKSGIATSSRTMLMLMKKVYNNLDHLQLCGDYSKGSCLLGRTQSCFAAWRLVLARRKYVDRRSRRSSSSWSLRSEPSQASSDGLMSPWP